MKKPLAVITGASSGIGAATAKAFSKAGYPTLLIARRLDIMESFKLENSMCRKVDVRDREALIAAIRAVSYTPPSPRDGTSSRMPSSA